MTALHHGNMNCSILCKREVVSFVGFAALPFSQPRASAFEGLVRVGEACELFRPDYIVVALTIFISLLVLLVQRMGKCKGCGKLGRMAPRDGSVSAYDSALLLSPVVSVWDCIVRKMRYSYIPEWV
ncbi:hypothetical protein I3842_06G002800 [Carya illinoinensis]|uniref:Uncharacterized protein n=2 Tax=Carya illinoinensis TaxID=32201 RepID=A0A922EMY7_CARIL|nr:hypothetical protein I3842_06G002800 [Carya illinoinensis]